MSGQDPRHPKSSYEAKYPYNRVMVTESGHESHWDDTKDKERVRIAHKSGSYTEFSPDGRRVDMTVGHQINYAKGGMTVTADKNVDMKVGGSMRTNVNGDSHSEIKGSQTSAVDGGTASMVSGDSSQAIKGDMSTGVTGSVLLTVGGSSSMKVDGGMAQKVTGSLEIESGASIVLKCGGMTVTLSGGILQIDGGQVRHNEKNIGDTHRHDEVEPGAGISGEPIV